MSNMSKVAYLIVFQEDDGMHGEYYRSSALFKLVPSIQGNHWYRVDTQFRRDKWGHNSITRVYLFTECDNIDNLVNKQVGVPIFETTSYISFQDLLNKAGYRVIWSQP